LEVPEAALHGSLKEMRRALRHHARDTGCSHEELTRRHEEIVFKLSDVPSGPGRELNVQKRRKALQQSFSHASDAHPYMLPIIHIESLQQAVSSATMAASAGAHGIWLINSGDAAGAGKDIEGARRVRHTSLKTGSGPEHEMGKAQLAALADCFKAVREAMPDFWIGLCVPQLNAAQVFQWVGKHCVTADALWLDELACEPAVVSWEAMGEGDYALQFALGIRNWLDMEDQLTLLAVRNARRRCSWLGLVFGTVASGLQQRLHHDQDAQTMGEACVTILRHWAFLVGSVCDVLVTTGPGDGGPCSSAKLQALSTAAPIACLGPVNGGCAAVRDAGSAELLFLDVADLGGASGNDKPDEARLHIDSEKLEKWVLTGTIPANPAKAPFYEPGEIREMATAALQERRKSQSSAEAEPGRHEQAAPSLGA